MNCKGKHNKIEYAMLLYRIFIRLPVQFEATMKNIIIQKSCIVDLWSSTINSLEIDLLYHTESRGIAFQKNTTIRVIFNTKYNPL